MPDSIASGTDETFAFFPSTKTSPDATFVDELAALLGKHGIAAGPDAELDMKTGKLTLSQVNQDLKK